MFQWPGYWIAVLAGTPESKEQTAVLMFGSPSGCGAQAHRVPRCWAERAPDLPVEEGYVIVHFDPAWSADSPSRAVRLSWAPGWPGRH